MYYLPLRYFCAAGLGVCAHKVSELDDTGIVDTQWRSQDEQVTWARHGNIQCARNKHLL